MKKCTNVIPKLNEFEDPLKTEDYTQLNSFENNQELKAVVSVHHSLERFTSFLRKSIDRKCELMRKIFSKWARDFLKLSTIFISISTFSGKV